LVTSNLGLGVFSKEIVIYLAGFVVHKLEKKLEVCSSVQVENKHDLLNYHISIKIKGGLCYPIEDDVISICMIF